MNKSNFNKYFVKLEDESLNEWVARITPDAIRFSRSQRTSPESFVCDLLQHISFTCYLQGVSDAHNA